MGVEARSDRRAALREGVEAGQRRLDPGDAELELGGVAREFLAERDRGRVLRMRAADLDDVVELARLGLQRLVQVVERGDQVIDS